MPLNCIKRRMKPAAVPAAPEPFPFVMANHSRDIPLNRVPGFLSLPSPGAFREIPRNSTLPPCNLFCINIPNLSGVEFSTQKNFGPNSPTWEGLMNPQAPADNPSEVPGPGIAHEQCAKKARTFAMKYANHQPATKWRKAGNSRELPVCSPQKAP